MQELCSKCFYCHPQNIIELKSHYETSGMARGMSLTENAIPQVDDANVLQGKNEREREFEQSPYNRKI